MASLEERQTNSHEQISSLTTTLTAIEDSLQDTLETLQKRNNGESDGSQTQPLIKIKEALRQMQQDIQDMHIMTGLLNHELIQRKRAAYIGRHHKKSAKHRNDGLLDEDQL